MYLFLKWSLFYVVYGEKYGYDRLDYFEIFIFRRIIYLMNVIYFICIEIGFGLIILMVIFSFNTIFTYLVIIFEI